MNKNQRRNVRKERKYRDIKRADKTFFRAELSASIRLEMEKSALNPNISLLPKKLNIKQRS